MEMKAVAIPDTAVVTTPATTPTTSVAPPSTAETMPSSRLCQSKPSAHSVMRVTSSSAMPVCTSHSAAFSSATGICASSSRTQSTSCGMMSQSTSAIIPSSVRKAKTRPEPRARFEHGLFPRIGEECRS